MKNNIAIHIPQPCHEDWQQMTPVDKGRFCQSCAKQVVDFSLMTDRQVLNYLSTASGRVCGRFAEDQLQRPLQPTKQEKKKIWWVAAAMPLLLVFGKVGAQKKKVQKDTAFVIPANQEMMTLGVISHRITPVRTIGDTIISPSQHIKGRVITEKGHAVPFASILVGNYPESAMADSAGYFTLRLPSYNDTVSIEATAIGYENARVQFTSAQKDGVTIVLKETVNKLPDLVVIGYGAIRCKKISGMLTLVKRNNFKEKVDTLIRNTFHTEPFKIYPNPAQRGQTITIDTKKQGEYSIQLFNNSGKLLQVKQFDATEGATQTPFTIPASAAAGIYYIRLVDEKTKKQYTDKVVVM